MRNIQERPDHGSYFARGGVPDMMGIAHADIEPRRKGRCCRMHKGLERLQYDNISTDSSLDPFRSLRASS